MDIIWLPLAKSALENIYFFYAKHSVAVAKRMIVNIKQDVKMLSIFPEMAEREKFLNDFPQDFRSLVVCRRKKKHKVVYFMKNNIVYIADIWDCRQDPDFLQED